MSDRRLFLKGAAAFVAMAPWVIRPSRAAYIPIAPNAIDAYTTQYVWPVINGGDTLQRVQFWAYPFVTWQLTGYAQGGNINNPDVPVMPDRAIELHGSNDGTCYGLYATLPADPAGMDSRMRDPIHDGTHDPRFWWVQPVVLGSVNPQGGDCSLILFLAKPFGTRP